VRVTVAAVLVSGRETAMIVSSAVFYSLLGAVGPIILAVRFGRPGMAAPRSGFLGVE